MRRRSAQGRQRAEVQAQRAGQLSASESSEVQKLVFVQAVFEAALMIDVVAVAVLAVDEVLAAVAKLAAVAELVAGAKLAAVAELAVVVAADVVAAGIVVADKLVADVERVVDLAAVAGAQSFASAAACAFVGTPCTAVAVAHVLDTAETAGCC